MPHFFSFRNALQSLKSPRSQRRRSRGAAPNAIAAAATVVTAETLEDRMLLSATTLLSRNGTFNVEYNIATDVLTIASKGRIDTFVIEVSIREKSTDGESPPNFRNVTLFTDRPAESPPFGVDISQQVIRSADPAGPEVHRVTIPNLLTQVVPSAGGVSPGSFETGLLEINRFPVGADLFSGGGFAGPIEFVGSDDSLAATFNTLKFLPVAQVPDIAVADQEVQIPFEVPLSTNGGTPITALEFDFGDGSESVRVDLEQGLSQRTVSHRFSQRGVFQVRMNLFANFFDISGEPNEQQIQTAAATVEVVNSPPESDSAFAVSRLLNLDAFDVVAIDELSRPATGVIQNPEVRFGFLQGRVSADAVNAAADESLSDLRVRVRPSVDVTLPASEVPDNVFVFETQVNSEGTYRFHMEQELFRAVGAGPDMQRLSPRLTARKLTLELLSEDGDVKDTITLERNALLELLNRGIVPSNDEFPRVLDIDLQVQDETLSLDGNARLNADILVHNTTLLSRILPDQSVMRVEIDFGDGSPKQGTNINPAALTSSHRTLNPPEFFLANTTLFGTVPFQTADRMRRHTYTETGEFEVTVTATLPNGFVSTATRTVTVVSAESAASELQVSNLQVRSKFQSQQRYSTLIGGRLEGFGDNPNPTLRLEIGGESVTLDITDLTPRGNGRFDFEVEVDRQETNLPRFVTEGTDLEDAELTARLTFFDNSNNRIEQLVQFGIQVPELFGAAITGTGRNQSLAFNLDTGVRRGAIESFIVELTNVRVEITRQEPGEAPVTEFIVANIVAEANSERVLTDLAPLAVEAHFGGADNVPDDLKIIGLTDDERQLQVRVFTRRNDLPDDTPAQQLKEALIDEQDFATSNLRKPFLHFNEGLLLSLRDGVESTIEGDAIDGLFGDFRFSGVRALNGVGTATLTSPDRSVAFERIGNKNSDEGLATIGTGNGPDVSPRRAGEVTIQIDDQFGAPLETITFDARPGGNPRAQVPSRFTPEQFTPGPLSSEEDRQLELVFVRGEVTGGFIDPIANVLDGLRGDGKIAFNTTQGAGDVRTLAAHKVAIDWGDGTIDEFIITPDDNVRTRIHTFSPDYLKRLEFVPRFGGAVLEGAIFVTVSELNDALEVVRTGARQRIEFDGPKSLSITASNDDVDFEIENSFAQDVVDDDSTEQRQLKQIRTLVAGDDNNVIRLPPGVGISQQFFDVVVDFGNGEVFRIVRDDSDRFTNTARMFRNAEGTGTAERVEFLQGAIRLVKPDNGELLFNYEEAGQFTIEFSQAAGIVIDGLDEPTEQKFGTIDVVVLPKIDVEINGDGSLSGTIGDPLNSLLTSERAELLLTPIDSPQATTPLRLSLGNRGDVSLDSVFAKQFFVPGRRLAVEFIFTAGEGSSSDSFVVKRVITPAPKLDIENVAISVAGSLNQLTPLDVTVTLGPDTLEKANNPGEGTFKLTISPGGGEADIVLERDAFTSEGEFTINGSNDIVTYNPVSGIIVVSQSALAGDNRVSYRNFGAHTFRAFSECSFGFTDVQISDVLPTVIEQVKLSVDVFGNVDVKGEVEAQNDVEIIVEKQTEDLDEDDEFVPDPNRVFNRQIGPREGPFDFLFNNRNIKAGDKLSVGIREDEGDQTVTVTEEATVAKRSIEVGIAVDVQDTERPLLTLDVRKLTEAATARAIAAGQSSESGNGSANASFTIQVGTGGDPIPAAVDVTVTDSISVVVTIGGQKFLADDFIIVPISFSETGPQFVTVADEDGCITGVAEVNLSETVNVPRNVKAIAHPDGTTKVTGVIPVGSNSPTTVFVTTPDGQILEKQIPADQREFAFENLPGGQVGDTVTTEIQGGGSSTVEIEAKQKSINVGIKLLRDADGSAGPVEFDVQDVIAELQRKVTESEFSSAQVTFTISNSRPNGRAAVLGILVEQEADGTFTSTLVQIFNSADEDIIQDGKFVLRFSLAQTREIIIGEVVSGDICITGRASFDISDSGEVIGATGPEEQIESNGNDSAEGSINVISNGMTRDAASVTVAPVGGSVTLEDGTEIADGEQRQVLVAVGDDDNEPLNFVFDPNPAVNPAQRVRQGEVNFLVVDPDHVDNMAELSTKFFFVREAGDPCEDHLFFPAGTTFAGDVTITLNGDDVLINGDAANNGLSITTDDRGIVAVPVGGTTINGLAADFVIFSGVTEMPGDLTVESMGEGDDFLCFTNFEVAGNADVTSTPGDDVVLMLDMTVIGDVDVDLGEDDDKLDMTGSAAGGSVIIDAGAGNDTIIGSLSNDEVLGGEGVDEIDGGPGEDEIIGGLGADIQRGGAGDDIFIWNNGDGPDDNFGGEGFDQFVFAGADGADDNIRLIPGNTAGDGGGDGTHPNPDFKLTRTAPSAFTIENSEIENASIAGLGGNDNIDASALPAGVLTEDPDFLGISLFLSGGSGDDVLSGSQAIDLLVGGSGNDLIIGNRGNDIGLGDFFVEPDAANSPGDDTFVWNNGDGADNFVGADGNDLFRFNGANGANDALTVTPGTDDGDIEANAAGIQSVDLNRTLPSAFTIETLQIENFEVNGMGGNDDINASSLDAGLLQSLTLNGNGGDDTLTGSKANDTLNGGAGNDTLNGFLGADEQHGGDDDDTFIWNNGDGPDDNFGGQGIDTFRFNGADGAADELRIVPESDVGAAGDGTHPNPEFDLTRTLPSAFTIENSGIENAEVNGLGGADTLNVVGFADVALDLNGGAPTAVPGDTLIIDAQDRVVDHVGDEIRIDGRQPINANGFESVQIDNAAVEDDMPPSSNVVRPASIFVTTKEFPINVVGTDEGSAPSGIAAFEIFVRENLRGPFTLFEVVDSEPGATPGTFEASTTFTGSSNTIYQFFSVAVDNAGNREDSGEIPRADILVFLSDVDAPESQVDDVEFDATTGQFSVNFSGTDVGGRIRFFDVFMAVDGAPATTVGTVNTSTAGSLQVPAIADGVPHDYRFFTVATDRRGNVEAPPAAATNDVVVNDITFTPPPQLEVTDFSIQHGAQQRSFINTLTLTFNTEAGIDDLIANADDRIGLFNTGLNGFGNTAISLSNATFIRSGRSLTINLGATGLTTDGFHELRLDLNSDDTFESIQSFHRLQGDSDGDGDVDITDLQRIRRSLIFQDNNPNSDVTGDGLVDILDLFFAAQNFGASLDRGTD